MAFFALLADLVDVLAGVCVVGLVAWVALEVVRFVQASPAARRHWPLRLWVALTWRKTSLGLDLAKVRKETNRIKTRPVIGPHLFTTEVGRTSTNRKITYPRLRVRADEYGVVARIRTLPKVGKGEFEKNAAHLADAWRVERVQVYREKPGRLVVRGLRRDPLAEHYAVGEVPADVLAAATPIRPYLGRDEWGKDRYLDLRGITGITVAGLARYGKSEAIINLLLQLGRSTSVQFVILDGKGSGLEVSADYADWVPRAWRASGDDHERAEEILDELCEHMVERGRVIAPVLGVRNGWKIGPTPDWPLIVTIVDECHSFFDDKAFTGSGAKAAKDRVIRMQSKAAQLVKAGGSVMMLTIFITQKQTGDAIPTRIRDNCTVGLSFAVRTRDAAVAGLGEAIRDAPSVCPTLLRERPTYIGVATAVLPDEADFVRLRFPHVPETEASARALLLDRFRSDPAAQLAKLVAALGAPAETSTGPETSTP